MKAEAPRVAFARFTRRGVAEDVLRLVAFGVASSYGGSFGTALALAIAGSIVWDVVTLHFPQYVELTGDGIAFGAYGRRHQYLWNEIERVRVRRFLVRDRVLVRIAPASPWRGRYWLTDTIANYNEIVRTLEARQA